MKPFMIFILFVSLNTYSSDHLEPDDSFYSNRVNNFYSNALKNGFKESFEYDVHLRVFVTPSFSPEYVVGVRFDRSNSNKIFYKRSRTQFWEYISIKQSLENGINAKSNGIRKSVEAEYRKILEKKPETIEKFEFDTCQKPINEKLNKSIRQAWLSTLYETKYNKKRTRGLDGTTYRFFAQDGMKELFGKVWSPKLGTRLDKLVKISNEMIKYCKNEISSQDLTVLINNYNAKNS